MDHMDAVRLNAVEKYISGELPEDVRDQFEEHYFDCVECASDLKALATFLTAGRMVLEEELPAKVPPRLPEAERAGWFGWLRPLVAVPAIAALAAIVVYQRAVTIPALQERAKAEPVAQLYESSYRVQGATRGENTSTITVEPNQSFALDFDFTPDKIFPSYKGNLLEQSGRPVLTFDVPAKEANKELHLVIPGGKVHSGKYDLALLGQAGSGSSSEVQRLSFAVEVRP
jgi:hypothetical protein